MEDNSVNTADAGTADTNTADTNTVNTGTTDTNMADKSTTDSSAGDYDIEFFWDPICPFAWVTSRWVENVAAQRDFKVNWRFISLSLLNEEKDYNKFPPGYKTLHTKGTAMLRVAAATRKRFGIDQMGLLYTALGESIWNRQPPANSAEPQDTMAPIATTEHLSKILADLDLPQDLLEAADDASLDAELRAETELALSRTGKNVGTPIITYRPPDGPSFFGPVISVPPEGEQALELWDAVLTLAEWPSFAELKRTKRDMPRLELLKNMERLP